MFKNLDMKILVISTMYPNKVLPVHAVFVRERVKAISKRCEVKVVSPIPYFPGTGIVRHGKTRNSISNYENQEGIDVFFPRFYSIPKILRPLDGISLFLSMYYLTNTTLKNYDFDLIDAHLAYPDGFGAILLGKIFNKPIVVTVRGHDLNVFPSFPIRGKQVSYTLRHASKIIAVAGALKQKAIALGADRRKVEVIPNGVDLARFSTIDTLTARKRLNLPLYKKIILSVGHLVKRKGFQYIIESLNILLLRGVKNIHVVIVGGPGEEGDYSKELQDLIKSKGIEENITLVGPRNHHELPLWYNSADIFCLASEKEGRPNVVLEAMACGLPVVATNVWGTKELIPSEDYGLLVGNQKTELLADAIQKAIEMQWDRKKITSFASTWSWERNSLDVFSEFQKLVVK